MVEEEKKDEEREIVREEEQINDEERDVETEVAVDRERKEKMLVVIVGEGEELIYEKVVKEVEKKQIDGERKEKKKVVEEQIGKEGVDKGGKKKKSKKRGMVEEIIVVDGGGEEVDKGGKKRKKKEISRKVTGSFAREKEEDEKKGFRETFNTNCSNLKKKLSFSKSFSVDQQPSSSSSSQQNKKKIKEIFALEKMRRQRQISIRRKKRKAFMAKALQKYFIDEAECGDNDSDDDDLAYLELDEEFIEREQAELDRQMVGFFILCGKMEEREER